MAIKQNCMMNETVFETVSDTFVTDCRIRSRSLDTFMYVCCHENRI